MTATVKTSHAQNSQFTTTATNKSPKHQLFAGPDDMTQAIPLHDKDMKWGVYCRLDQALGVLGMITGNAAEGDGEFTVSTKTIHSALWAIESLVQDALKILHAGDAPTEKPTAAPQACTCHRDGLPMTSQATRGELTATIRAIDGHALGQFHLQSLRGLILGMRAAAGDAETTRHVADSADRLIDDFAHTNAAELATLNAQLDALKAGAPAEPETLPLEKRLNALIGAGNHLQQYIESGDIVVRYPAPSNAALPDPRRQAMEIFAATLAAVEGGT